MFLALQLMASALTNNTRCLMPPCPIEEVVWPNIKTKFSFYTTLSNTRGWVSVSGPRGSGKSLRVLSSCHSLLANRSVGAYHSSVPIATVALLLFVLLSWRPHLTHLVRFLSYRSYFVLAIGTCCSKDRDFIWVDLQGVESEMEAVSRAVYQLGMRKQVPYLSI